MKFKKIVMTFFMLLGGASLFGCAATNKEEDGPNTTHYSEIYTLTLDSLMSLDDGLNHEMEYIALDVKSLTYATEEDKEFIVGHLVKYGVNVIDESIKSLEEKGMVKEHGVIDGVLLKIEKVELKSDNKIVIESSKYRSGKGAVVVETILIKKGGNWQVEKSTMIMMS